MNGIEILKGISLIFIGLLYVLWLIRRYKQEMQNKNKGFYLGSKLYDDVIFTKGFFGGMFLIIAGVLICYLVMRTK